MPPKRRPPGGKGKKGRRGKGKKGGKKKKKVKVQPEPPPLHLLTELYKKMDEETKMLYEMRIAARRKRIECWFMAREIMNTNNDNNRYKDAVEYQLEFLRRAMDKLMKLLQEERDSINKAIQSLLDEYEKRRLEYLRKAGLLEEELANVRSQLEEFEPMMRELERLMARLAELQRQIEEAQTEANVKILHLTNQFLNERSRLHNHLEEQLYYLIEHCRSFIMPILWNFMQNLIRDNLCARWTLAHVDEKYIALAERREQLVLKRKLLTLEKPYWNIDWSFQKLEEIDSEKKRQRRAAHEALQLKLATSAAIPISNKQTKSLKAVVKSHAQIQLEEPAGPSQAERPETLTTSTQLGRDFNVYLVQRLTAAKEAQERHARAQKREEKRFLKKILEEANNAKKKLVSQQQNPGQEKELEGFQGESEEEEEGEGEEEWTERVKLRRGKHGAHRRRQLRKDAAAETDHEDDEDEWEDEDDEETEPDYHDDYDDEPEPDRDDEKWEDMSQTNIH